MFETVLCAGVQAPLRIAFVGVAQGQEARVALRRDWHWYSLPGERKRSFVKVFDVTGDRVVFFIPLQQWETFTPEQAQEVIEQWMSDDWVCHPNGHHHLFVPLITESCFQMSVVSPDAEHLRRLQEEAARVPEHVQMADIRFRPPLLYWALDLAREEEEDQLLLVGISR